MHCTMKITLSKMLFPVINVFDSNCGGQILACN